MAQMKLFTGYTVRKRKLAVGGAGELDLQDDLDLDYEDKVRVIIEGHVVSAKAKVERGEGGGRAVLDAAFSIATDNYSIEKL